MSECNALTFFSCLFSTLSPVVDFHCCITLHYRMYNSVYKSSHQWSSTLSYCFPSTQREEVSNLWCFFFFFFLQLWDHGHRQAGCVHRRSLLWVSGGTLYQPHCVCGRVGSGERSWILDCTQLMGRAMGKYSVNMGVVDVSKSVSHFLKIICKAFPFCPCKHSRIFNIQKYLGSNRLWHLASSKEFKYYEILKGAHKFTTSPICS